MNSLMAFSDMANEVLNMADYIHISSLSLHSLRHVAFIQCMVNAEVTPNSTTKKNQDFAQKGVVGEGLLHIGSGMHWRKGRFSERTLLDRQNIALHGDSRLK